MGVRIIHKGKTRQVAGFLKTILVVFSVGIVSPAGFVQGTADDGPELQLTGSTAIHFRRGPFIPVNHPELDTSLADREPEIALNSLKAPGRAIRIIQFRGPIRRQWMEALRATGAEILGYLAHNAYIIASSPTELHAVAALSDRDASENPIAWMGRFRPLDKLDPELDRDVLEGRPTAVEIQLLDSPQSMEAIETISRMALSVNSAPRGYLRFVVLSVTLPSNKLMDAAGLEEVLAITPAGEIALHDERSAQIVAGNLVEDLTRPSSRGYLDWLARHGLDSVPDHVLDVTDSGLDHGFNTPLLIHPDNRTESGESRISYSLNYTRDAEAEDRSGHGSIVVSIAAGNGNSGRVDEEGYLLGMGVDPFVPIGVSRLFGLDGRLPFTFSFTNVAGVAHARGARVSNNSWGKMGNRYDASSQEFDALVRDSRPGEPGNHEMVFVFSAGNSGPGGRISSPGTAKNVITVGASENYRPYGFDSCNLDGEGAIGPEGADNALDLLRFSSGGPTEDGRAKPDIVAPGTHVYGAASQARFFNAGGLCPGITLYQPPGQRLYTWSSGTSLAAPHVSGAASLLRRHGLGLDSPPSPALTKALLVNGALYLDGEHAGGDLPSPRQGWGLLNLSAVFDETPRLVFDQTEILNESGQEFKLTGSLADPTKPLKVTLAWTDVPGTLAGPALVNDLDLEVIIGGVTIYRGNNFEGPTSFPGGEPDRLNNVESIFIPAEHIPEGPAGNFTILVRAANVAGDGIPWNDDELDQDFALVVSNIRESLDDVPPAPAPEVPVVEHASYVKKWLSISGKNFTAKAGIEVNGKLIDRKTSFIAETNTIQMKWGRAKLNLIRNADNVVVIVEDGKRSPPFVFRF